MIALVGNSLWHLIVQSDLVSKLVLLILLVASILCWTIFIMKYIFLRAKQRALHKVLEKAAHVRTLDDLLLVASQHSGTLPSYFLSKNILYVKSLLELRKEQSAGREMEMTEQYLDQTLDTVMNEEESYLPVLSTTAAISPLLGLFGTVWGLIHAFIRITEKQSADITTVAPGIAEALITTLAGLIVAIPAMIMYNYLSVQIRKLEQQILMLGDTVRITVHPLLLK